MAFKVNGNIFNIEIVSVLISSFVCTKYMKNVTLKFLSPHMELTVTRLYIVWLIITLHNLALGLQPQSYGGSETGGYKAAYAKAREMREMRFAAKGEDGPKEAALEQTFQVGGNTRG